MKITTQTINDWLNAETESESLEFKEAKTQFDNARLLEYCVALSNERGGYIVLGVTDKRPRRVVGSQAYFLASDINDIKLRIVHKLGFRVEVTEIQHPDGRVLVFSVPSRPIGHPLSLDGKFLMRTGESLTPMTPDQLKVIFSEGQSDWLSRIAKEGLSPEEVVALLDTQAYFELSNLPYPSTREGVLDKLKSEQLIVSQPNGWAITNVAAMLLAKNLKDFPLELSRKASRVVIYDGIDKTVTKEDRTGIKGYAVGFSSLIEHIHSAAPLNRSVEQVVREEVKMFPKQALRELIANALVHQDFLLSGMSVMIEMYSDRVEISNPGIPPIRVERFIDEYRSRNERLADLMRRLGICEEKGSGIDKVISAVESYQLPAPDIRVGDHRTTVVLFAHQNFSEMGRDDRVRACYHHCCLMHVSNQKMSNQSLRLRFGLAETRVAVVSSVIAATKESGLINLDESDSSSTRYARYLPFWA